MSRRRYSNAGRRARQRRSRRWSRKLTGTAPPPRRVLRTVQSLKDVGVFEAKSIPFSTRGRVTTTSEMLPAVNDPVYTNKTDVIQIGGFSKAALSTKVFNLGTRPISDPLPEVYLDAFKMVDKCFVPGAVAGNNEGPYGFNAQGNMIGKQIFAKKTFISLSLRYAVPKYPYSWGTWDGSTPGQTVTQYIYGNPAWYTPIRYRLLIVKFKRDNFPADQMQQLRTRTAYPEYLLGAWDQSEAYQPAVRQSPVNRCLLLGPYGDSVGVAKPAGSTGWESGPRMSNFQYFKQPVSKKYWDVIYDKVSYLHPPPITPPSEYLTSNVTRGAAGAMGAGAAATTHDMMSLTPPTTSLAGKNTHKVHTFTLPWHDRVQMGNTGNLDQETVTSNDVYFLPRDRNMEDVKIVLIADRPAWSDKEQAVQQELKQNLNGDALLPHTAVTDAGDNGFTPQIECTINGNTFFTDA